MQDDPFARAVARADAAEEEREQARRHERAERCATRNRLGLRVHLAVFVMVNILLTAIWATTYLLLDGPSYPWFLWPLLGWGIGLAAHYAAARPHVHRRG